jgi:hypothetical protein
VQKHADTGMSQEDFVQTLMTTFRYTQYLVKKLTAANTTNSRTGRLKLTRAMFQSDRRGRTVASTIHIEDRVGYLGSTFAGMEQLALQRQSTAIEFAHHALPGDTRFSLIVSPVIAPCLSQLSARPTVQGLHEMNRAFAQQQGRTFEEVEAQDLLLALLAFIERRNLITYYSQSDIEENATDDDAGTYTVMLEGSAKATAGGSGLSTVGGLKVKTSSAHSTAGSAQHAPSEPSAPDLPGPLTKRLMDKDAAAVEGLRALGHPYSVIEEILLSEARREEARKSEATKRGSGGAKSQSRGRSVTDHILRALQPDRN